MRQGSTPGARAAGSANPTSGHSPMVHSGIAKTVPSVTMRTCDNQCDQSGTPGRMDMS